MVQKQRIDYTAVLLALLGITLFSSKAVMVKLAYRYHVDHLTLLLLRMVFALPIYAILSVTFRKPAMVQLKKSDYLWLVAFAFLGYYLASLFDFMGLQYLKAGLERVILFIYPTIVVLLNRVIFKQKITSAQSWAIAITYVGVVFTVYPEIGFHGTSVAKGAFFILLSAITFAFYIVGSGWLIPKFGVMRFTAYAMMISAGFVIGHYLAVGGDQAFQQPNEVYWLGLAMALFATLIPSFLTSFAIKRMGASSYSILGSWGPVSTILLAYIFLDERIMLFQWIGMAIVIGGIVILSLSRKKKI